MVKTTTSRSRKIIVFLILFSLLATSSSLVYNGPNYGAATSAQGDNGNPLESSNQNRQLAADPSASPRPVNESAIGFEAGIGVGRPVYLPSSGTNDLPVTIDYNWVGTKLYTTVTGLWDQKNWANNGNFTSNSNGWSFWSRDAGSSNTITNGWASSGAGGNPGYVWAQINGRLSGGFYYYDARDTIAWNQTATVPRGTVISARLEFKYYVVNRPMLNTLGANIYGWVGNSWAFNISYPSISVPYDSWHSASVDVPVSKITLPNVLVSLGHYQIGTYGYSSLDYVRVYFDEVRLTVKALVKPEQVKLKLAAPGYPNTNCSITSPSPSSYGMGSGTLSGFTIGPASQQTYYFDYTSNVTSPTTGYFLTNATIYVKRQNTATASFVNQGSNINWSISLVTWPQRYGQSVSTTNYTMYYYNVSVPSDWSLTSCKDPNGAMHSIVTGPIFSNWTEGSIRILRVNVTNVGSYSTPPNYYPYIVYALSNNYVKQVWTQMKNGAIYTNETKFYPQNWTRFAAYIAGVGGPISTGIANLTISGPPTYGASPVVLATVTGVTPSAGYAYFLVHWNSTNAAGSYTGEVDWVNSSLGEAGSLTCSYDIFHRFNLTITYPATGDVILSPSLLASPPTSARVRDYYTGESMSATVMGKASWENRTASWHLFSAGADVGLYTNVTHVPSGLALDSNITVAANASKSFYDIGIANNTVYIGWATGCTPSSRSFHVRHTESQAYSVSGSFTYYVPPSTPIADATLTLLADASSNDSEVQWSSRTVLDSSNNATGVYSVTIYMFTQTAKGIPTGSFDVWFKLSKGIHGQTQIFKMAIQVDSQPTVLNVLTGDGQSVFWGDTALVQINFTTQLAGSYDWLPFVSLPVRNLSYYVPPYVRVTVDQGIHKWTYNWTVKPDTLYPGVYNLYFDTRLFPNPTPSGAQVQIDVGFHKPSYDDPTGKLITLYIKSLTTSETGAIWNGAGYSLTNTTSVYPGDSKSIFIWYNDTHTGLSMGVGGASVSYTTSGGLLGSGTLSGVPGKLGLYNLTLVGTITDRTPGVYYLYVAASKGNYYVQHNITLTLNILPLPTTLQAPSSSASVFYLDRVVFLIWFNDTHNGVPISGATMSATAPGVSLILPFEVSGQPGLWNLTIPGGQAVGHYSITLQASKSKYATDTETLTLDVDSLPTVFSSYVVTSSGQVLVQPNATIPQGQTLTIYLWFNDTLHSAPIVGMENSITYTSTEFGHGWVSATTTPGLYKVVFQTPDAGIFTITFSVSATGYESKSIAFQAIIQAPPPGFNIFTVALVGVGGGGIVVVAAVAWLFIRRARMPFIIKKIDETLKLISKGEHEEAKPVALRSREELVVGITNERIDVFGRRPAGAEGPEEGAAVTARPTPTREESALRTELAAVETKEKPGEAIEEVEMDTLDAELQKLEKFEDKEKLPDGAKEVRDVIEKYKDGKKKKKE